MSDTAQEIRALVEELLVPGLLDWPTEQAAYRTRLDALLEPLRWRKWPEERPEKDGLYLVMYRQGGVGLSTWCVYGDDIPPEWLDDFRESIVLWRPLLEPPEAQPAPTDIT